MLWVNSFWSLSEVPHWLRHAAVGEDMLGFSDIIFPAFLFIVGASVPFAIENRLRKGDSLVKLLYHILIRSAALVILGIFTSNFGSYGAEATGIDRNHFALLMTLGVFMTWNAYPKSTGWKKHLFIALGMLGVVLLVYLAIIYRSKDGAHFELWGRWRILGLIGWTYLFCSLFYLIIRQRLWWHAGILALVVAGSILQTCGILPKILPIPFTILAFGVTGLVLSLLIVRYVFNRPSPRTFYILMAVIGVAMLGVGMLSHHFWIINKISATTTWFFYCCAIFFPLFGLLYWLADANGKADWFKWVLPAGTGALTCFMMEYIWDPIKNMIFNNPLLLPKFSVGTLGLLNSALYALLVILVVWLLSKIHIRLKL